MQFHRKRELAAAVLLLVFCVVFYAKVPRAHFGDDEPRNLYTYWAPGGWRVAMACVAFWSKFVRPMAALYYLPLYSIFGLNPVPYSYVRLMILLVNTAVFYCLARGLGRSWWIATLATFPMAYQANLGNLAYDGAFIYDILCGGFYFGALLYYIKVRSHAQPLRARQVCLFLALYICALDSKEMAVTLPVILLAYELLFHGRSAAGRRAALVPVAIAIAITIVFIVGKSTGEGSLTTLEAYRPVFSWSRFSERSTLYLNTFFYTGAFTMRLVLLLWAVLLYVSLRNWRSRRWDPRWLFWWIWVMVTPLPIVFLPGRGAATLYIVTAGWAMLAAMTMRALVRVLNRESKLTRLTRSTTTAWLLVCANAYAYETWHVDQQATGSYLADGERTQRAIDQLRELQIRPAPRSRIVFLNDPFPDRYYTYFIAAMLWGDRSLEINLQQRYPLADSEIAKMDYVLDYAEGQFIVRKRPGGP